MTPVSIFRHAAADNIKVKVAQADSLLADLARADKAMVDLCNRTDLRAGPAEEHFVCQIEFSPIDLPFLNFHPHLVPKKLNHTSPRDAFENIVRNWRCAHDTIAQHEEIGGRPLGNMPI